MTQIAVVYCVIMIVFIFIGILFDEMWVAILALIIGMVGFFAALIGRSFYKEYAWVECKNRKGKATYDQVQKCINEYNDYKARKNKEYRYVSKYFASASGFVENALKLAMDNDIICYEYNKNEKFEKVTYWK